MRRLLFIVALATLSLAACNNDNGENRQDWMDKVPGLEQNQDENTGKNYTSYKGHTMPINEYSYDLMMGILNLVSTQHGDIDDTEFLRMLTSSPLSTEALFMADVCEGTKLEWYSIYDYVGLSAGGTIQANDNGTITSIFYPNSYEIDVMHHMSIYDIKGFYTTYYWEYHADSNILISSHTKSGEKMIAELLYFDGTEAVMLGKIAGISNTGTSLDSYGRECIRAYELHHLKFQEGGRLSLEGYKREYVYQDLKMVSDIEAEMESLMRVGSNYDVEAFAQELSDSKWTEWGILRYFDETMSHIKYPDAWDGKWNAEGGAFSDYEFVGGGTGFAYEISTAEPPFESIAYNIDWSFDPETKALTMYYQERGITTTATVSAYYTLGESDKFMVWDVDNSWNERIVLKKIE